jgi:hypothetical protein
MVSLSPGPRVYRFWRWEVSLSIHPRAQLNEALVSVVSHRSGALLVWQSHYGWGRNPIDGECPSATPHSTALQKLPKLLGELAMTWPARGVCPLLSTLTAHVENSGSSIDSPWPDNYLGIQRGTQRHQRSRMDCLVCLKEAKDATPPTYRGLVLECPRCGIYRVTGNATAALRSLKTEERMAVLRLAKMLLGSRGVPTITSGAPFLAKVSMKADRIPRRRLSHRSKVGVAARNGS